MDFDIPDEILLATGLFATSLLMIKQLVDFIEERDRRSGLDSPSTHARGRPGNSRS